MRKRNVREGGGEYRSPLFVYSAGLILFLGLAAAAWSGEAGLRIKRATPEAIQGRVPDLAGHSERVKEFPHLLIARGPRTNPTYHTPGLQADDAYGRAAAKAGGRDRFERLGNAYWDPEGILNPSVLPMTWRDRSHALLNAADSATRRDLLKEYDQKEIEPVVLRILAIRVDFLEDTPGYRTTGNGRFDLRRDEEARAIPVDPPPHDKKYFESHLEALARYYDFVSGGALKLEYDVYPAENDSAYHLADTRKYGPWVFSNSNPDVLQHAIDLVGDALAVADSADAEAIDFSQYQSFIVFHAGADFQSDVNWDSPWDIPSFNLFVADPFLVQDGSVPINLVMVQPETVSQDGFLGAMNGVMAHEFGHQLGFHDLYDVRNGLTVVGSFSLMDSGENLYGTLEDPREPGSFLAVRGTLPSSLDPWHKLYLLYPYNLATLDMVTPDSYLEGDSTSFTVDLPAVELSNQILNIPLNLAEELLIENRRFDLNGDSTIILRADPETGVILGPEPDSSAAGDTLAYREYDYLLPGEGILIWHVDWKAIYSGLNTPYGGVNINFGRPGVALVEADGIRDIGTASSEYLGGPYDPFFQGGFSRLGPDTRPSTDTNDGTPTGLEITVLDSIGMNMRLRVDTGRSPGGWPLAYVGLAGQEQSLVLDMNADAAPEYFTVAGAEIFSWGLDASLPYGRLGCPACFLQSPLSASIEHGLAARVDYACPDGECPDPYGGPLLALVSGRTLRLVDGGGRELAVWPVEPTMPPGGPGVSTTPVVLTDWILAGCDDGAVRVFVPDAADPLRAEFYVAEGEIAALGAGYIGGEGDESSLVVFYAGRDGEMGAFLWDGALDSESVGLFSVRRPGAEEPVSVLGANLGASSAPRFLYVWEDGRIDWRESDGSAVEGWPVQLPAAPAGQAILCDADQDGVLEILAADAGAYLHCFGPNGVEEYMWPRRLWSEDVASAPEQLLGPLALDVAGDGAPEILIHRTDGILLALDGRGREVEGWPFSAGSQARSGPHFVPESPGFAPRLVLENANGYTRDDRPITAVTMARAPGASDESRSGGFYPVFGVDSGRSRAYPRAWIPLPVDAEGDFQAETLRIYPNPLRGDEATVRFVLGKPAAVTLDAFDLSGRKAATLETRGRAGAEGNHVRWDLSGLAPGMYHIRFRVDGEGFQEDRFLKMAIVR